MRERHLARLGPGQVVASGSVGGFSENAGVQCRGGAVTLVILRLVDGIATERGAIPLTGWDGVVRHFT